MRSRSFINFHKSIAKVSYFCWKTDVKYESCRWRRSGRRVNESERKTPIPNFCKSHFNFSPLLVFSTCRRFLVSAADLSLLPRGTHRREFSPKKLLSFRYFIARPIDNVTPKIHRVDRYFSSFSLSLSLVFAALRTDITDADLTPVWRFYVRHLETRFAWYRQKFCKQSILEGFKKERGYVQWGEHGGRLLLSVFSG